MIKKMTRLLSVLFITTLLSGCLLYTAADLAATTVLTTAKIAVKATGAVADAVIPDSDDEDEDKDED